MSSPPNKSSPRIAVINTEEKGVVVQSPDDELKPVTLEAEKWAPTKVTSGGGNETDGGTQTFTRGSFDITVHSKPESLFRSTSMDNLLSIVQGERRDSLDNTTHCTIHDVLQTCIKVTNT